MIYCQHADTCLNNVLCHLCKEESLLRLPPIPSYDRPKTGKRRQGDKFEKDSAKKYRKKMTLSRGRPKINSGSMWFDSGGDFDAGLFTEEMKDTAKRSQGKGSISIKKEWLDKAIAEQISNGKPPCISFCYKDADEIYTVFNRDDILDLVLRMRALEAELIRMYQEESE